MLSAAPGCATRRGGVCARVLLLLATFTIVYGGAIAVLRVREGAMLDRLIRDALEQSEDLAGRMIEASGQLQAAYTKDYGQRDETASYIDDPNDQEWHRVHLLQPLATYGLAGTWVFDGAGKLVDRTAAEGCELPELPLDPGRLGALFPGFDPIDYFVESRGVPIHIRGIPVRHRRGQDEAPERTGYLFSARAWNRDVLARLSHMCGLRIELSSARGAEAAADEIDRAAGSFAFSRLLRGLDGSPIGELRFHGEREAIRYAGNSMARTIAVLASLGAVLALALTAFLTRWVIRPLRWISAALRRESAAPLAPLAGRADEFAAVAHLMKRSFAHKRALEDEVVERRRIELELAAARDQALAATRAKSAFLASMSHEIRTPLNGVIGMARVLEEEPLNPDQHDCARTIRDSAEALLSIVSDVLDFSKIEAGKVEFEQSEFDPGELVEDVVDLFAIRAFQKGLAIQADIASELPRAVLGDHGRVRQILANLVGNALKFTEHGSVVVRARLARRSVLGVELLLEVADTGIGIPENRKARVFESFCQADAGTSRRYGGTGLGLTISLRLAQQMNGSITLESEPGRGTTFIVRLPFSLPAGGAAADAARTFAGVHVLWEEADDVAAAAVAARCADLGIKFERTRGPGETEQRLARTPAVRVVFAAAIPVPAQGPAPAWILLHRMGDSSVPKAGHAKGRLRKPVRRSALAHALAAALSSQHAPVPQPRRRVAEPLRGRTILLVDDHPVNLMVGSRLLRKLGATVTQVESGIAALAACAEWQYDAILLDCQMPILDGFEVAAEIRRREGSQRHTPIIAVTADVQPETWHRSLAVGMDECVSKPIILERLLEALGRCSVSAVKR